jgi:ABC-2 type transport system ATP-binding protein
MKGLVVHGVVAQDSAGPRGTPRGGLGGVTFGVERGITAIVGTPEDGTIALLEVLSGVKRPTRGVVAIDDLLPSKSPELRAHLGVLGVEPTLPPARTVLESVAIAIAARPRAPAPPSILEAHGLAALGSRPLASLSRGEARAVERALALEVHEPAAVVLFEPFLDDVLGSNGTLTESKLAAFGQRAPVIVITSSLADARAAEVVMVLTRGAIVHRAPADEVIPKGALELVVELERGARAFARELAGSPAIVAVGMEARGSGDDAAGTVRLAGADPAAVGAALALATTATHAVVSSVTEVPAPLAEIRALSEWQGRIRDAAARQAAALRSQMGRWSPGAYWQQPQPGPQQRQPQPPLPGAPPAPPAGAPASPIDASPAETPPPEPSQAAPPDGDPTGSSPPPPPEEKQP